MEFIDRRDALQALIEPWNALVQEDSRAPLGMDVTATIEWHCALLDAFLPEPGGWRILVARDDRGIAGILPFYWTDVPRGPGRAREIALLTELFGGRNGFLVRGGESAVLQRMLAHLRDEVVGWDSLRVHLTDGSRSQRMLNTALHDLRCTSAVVSEEVSPILEMPAEFDAYIRSLKPGFRTELQRRDKRLRAAGAVEFEIIDSAEQVAAYLQDVDEIERNSWKEAAGSSITARPREHRFYRALLPRAAAAGQLLSGLLRVDGQPVAYRMSVAFAGTAIGLKTSYVQELRALAPATVLQWMYLREIHRRGVRTFDFTGVCEPHKTRWTANTYTLHTYRIFQPGMRGRLARLRHVLGARARATLENA